MDTINLLNSKIGLKLVVIGKMSKIFALQRFAAMGHEITPEQFTVLAALAENNGMFQRQIGTYTLKDRPNITRIINILEKMELVTRISDVEKRKVYKIYITEKGKEVYSKVLPTVLDIWSATVKNISENEISTTLQVLEKIRKNLEGNLNIH